VNARANRGPLLPPGLVRLYEEFHGVEPDRFEDRKMWVPGELVCVGTCLDVGYTVIDKRSTKDGHYVHDHGEGVKLYQRALPGERVAINYDPPPRGFAVIGRWLGCTYLDEDGRKREIKGTARCKALATPDRKRLFVMNAAKGGIIGMIKGGNFRVKDWLYE